MVKFQSLEKEIATLRRGTDSNLETIAFLREEVTEEEIASIVSRWTGIPVTKLVEGEREKLLRLKDTLHERVVGQDEAVTLVTEAVWRARSGIKDPNQSQLDRFYSLVQQVSGKQNLAKALSSAVI